MKAHIVSLGCPKNLVDMEASLSFLERAGCETTTSPESADVLIVSACSFLERAWLETVDEVEKLARLKADDPGKKLMLMGCLPVHRKIDLARKSDLAA